MTGKAPAQDDLATLRQQRDTWLAKPVLRLVYNDFYRRMSAHLVAGRTLEVGGGPGGLKAFLPEIVSSDILPAEWLDMVADAQRLPFADESFCNIFLVDTLHHLERPKAFFSEAARVLGGGGRVILVEPAITPVSHVFYRFFHPEPVRLDEDPLAEGGLEISSDPYDGNQAVPSLLFLRDPARFERLCPKFTVKEVHLFGLAAYPLSGGFRRWSLLPRRLAAALLRIEKRLEPRIGRWLAFRLLAVVECR